MALVRLVYDFPGWDVFQFTPGASGVWQGVSFTTAPTARADYAVLLYDTSEPTHVRCPAGRLWAVVGEPPNEYFGDVIRRMKGFARIYSADESLVDPPWIPSHPAIGWQVRKTYDELRTLRIPDKTRSLSWITSNIAAFKGHRARLRFLARIRDQVSFDLYGRGNIPIDDKWHALAPYRYSIVVENHFGPYYWSEKLADALLAWSMPIYAGCTRLESYFPAEAVIRIDINDPDVIEKIREATDSQAWLRNRDAIAYARNLILERYQPIAFLASEVRAIEARKEECGPDVDQVVNPLPKPGFKCRMRAAMGRLISS